MIVLMKKSDLEFYDGAFVNKENGVVYNIPRSIKSLIGKLDSVLLGNAAYDACKGIKEDDPLPTIAINDSSFDISKYLAEKPKTPEHDKRAETAKKIMAEADAVSATTTTNDKIKEFADLIDWAGRDRIFVEDICDHMSKIADLKIIKDPLTLTPEDIVDAIHKNCASDDARILSLANKVIADTLFDDAS